MNRDDPVNRSQLHESGTMTLSSRSAPFPEGCATSRVDTPLWLFALCALAFAAAGFWWLDWSVRWATLWPALLDVIVLQGIATAYRVSGRSDALARLGDAMALTIALALTCQAATYVLATTGGPFRTSMLAQADRLLGFSWFMWKAWVTAHPLVDKLLSITYPLHFAASAVAVTVLALRTERGAGRFLRAFLIAFGVSIVFLLLVPAFTNTPAAPSNAIRMALRNGSFHEFDLSRSQGLISFPSMHAVLAILVLLALWPFRKWRAPLGLFTALMLVATVSEGGHYLVDVLAGSVLGSIVWWVSGKTLS